MLYVAMASMRSLTFTVLRKRKGLLGDERLVVRIATGIPEKVLMRAFDDES
jgi:hypothetical protein